MLAGRSPTPPLFTDTQVPDGTWIQVLAEAEKATDPVNSAFVARIVDMRSYTRVIETDAFDPLALSLIATDLAHVVRRALDVVVVRCVNDPHLDCDGQAGRNIMTDLGLKVTSGLERRQSR